MNTSDSENTNNTIAWFKPSRKFYVFLISLFLASAFWLLNALNKTYVEDVNIAIKYVNLPANRAFSPLPPSTIKVELSGDGYSLMQLMKTAENDTVVIDLAEIEFETHGFKKRASIPTSVVVDELRGLLSNGVNISRISRDTIIVNTEIGATQELPIKPNYTLTLEKGFVLQRPVYTIPEVIAVHGAKSVLDKTKEIETHHESFEKLSETTELMVDIDCNRRFIQTNTYQVKLIAEVEPLTEGEIEVPIQVLGIPKGKKLRLIPRTVKVKYTTGLSHFDFIGPELFGVSVNYEDVLANPSKVQVHILSHPTYVNVVHFIPERVDYLILDLTN